MLRTKNEFKAKSRAELRVTLGPKGTFYLNAIAYEGLGSPAAVEMLYDGNRRIIGLRPTEPRKRNAFEVREHTASGRYKRVSAAAFCQHFRLNIRETLLFDRAEIDNDGVLRLPFEGALVVSRGAR